MALTQRCRIALVAAVATALSWAPWLSSTAAAATPPNASFTAAALPTWQTNGEVYAMASAQGLVFVAGNFSRVRLPGEPDLVTTTVTNPDGTTTTTTAPNPDDLNRANFAVFDAATGAPTSCTADVALTSSPSTVTVRSLNVSPDGQTLYVGGLFNQIGGATRQDLAALDISTCTVVAGFNPTPTSFVRAIASTPTTVYLGGAFFQVGGQNHLEVAAVNAVGTASPGAVISSFTPSFDGATVTGPTGALIAPDVDALALKPDDSVLVVGGWFDTVNGTASHALAVVDAATGATVKVFPNFIQKAGQPNNLSYGSAVKTIVVDDTGFYTGNEGTGNYVFDGRLAVDWGTYAQRWRDNCFGATQALVVYNSLLYSGSHAHDCSDVGGFGNGPRHHFLAETLGTPGVTNVKPTLAGWTPDCNDGIGEAIGPRTLTVATTGSVDYLWSGGEFTTVNGVAQQGLTRFGHATTMGPVGGPTPTATSTVAGQVRVAWRTSVDNDDPTLTYNVYRDGGATPVYTTTASSLPWDRPQVTWIDTSQPSGTTHTYRVTASDATQTVSGATAAVTVSGVSSAYEQGVDSDNPDFLLRYDESSGSFLSDASGNNNNFSINGTVTYQQPGALLNDPSRAISFGGNGNYAVSESRFTAPATFTLETWFKTATTLGGRLIGFGDSQTNTSEDYDSRNVDPHFDDKTVYMTTSGQLEFGTEPTPNNFQTLVSPLTYNDNGWHYAVATQDATGMTLYVDGNQVAHNTVTANGVGTGYWRIAGDTLKGWPGNPGDPGDGFWQGTLDETAVYEHALAPTDVAQHYVLGGAGSGPPPGIVPVVVSPTADTFGNAGAPNTNYGADAQLQSRGSPGAAAYLRFVLPPAPAGKSLVGAVLRVHTSTDPNAGSTSNHTIRIANDNWTQSTLAWNNRPAIAGTLLGTIVGATAVNTSYDVLLNAADLASYLGTQQSFGISSTGTDGLYVWSTNFGTTASRPQLLLSFAAAPDTTPPTAPGSPTAAVTNQTVSLQWTAATDDVGVIGYNVYRSATSGFTPSPDTEIAEVTGTSTTDTPGAGTWYYAVTADDAAGNAGPPSGQATAVVADQAAPATPGAPSGQVVNAGDVSVSWPPTTDNVGVTGYDVYRSPTSGFIPSAANLVVTVLGDTRYLDPAPGTGTWYYRVDAFDAAGNVSAASPEGSVVVPPADTTPPSSPGTPTATVAGSVVNLSWPAATDDVGVAGYQVYRSATSGFTPSPALQIATVTGTSYADTNPGVGTWYYEVVATDAAGNAGPPSAPATAVMPLVLSPTADAFVNASAPSTNFGSDPHLQSRGTAGLASYLRFVLPTAPAGQALVGAVLRVHTSTDPNAASTDTHNITIAGDNWTESTISWTNRPSVAGPLLGTLSNATALNASYDVTLNSAELAAYLGTEQTLGISSTGLDSLYLWSQNYGTATSRPQLLLSFATPGDTTPPTVPTGVAATVNAPAVTLSWNAATDDTGVAGYSVYRSPTSGFTPSPATFLATTPANTTSYTDANPGAGSWSYQIVARDAVGNLSSGSTETSVVVPTVVTVTPAADTFANAGAPSTSYGTDLQLQSRGTVGETSYLRFVLPPPPAGKTLIGAVLRIHTSTDASAGSTNSHSVNIASDAWTESTLTWNNRPAINGALVGTISGATAVNTSYDVQLSPSALAAFLGTQQTIAISSTGTDGLYLWSQNYGTAGARPQLILSFG